MIGCVEITTHNDTISTMKMTATDCISINLKKRVSNLMMDGEFKMPLPKRRNDN